MNIVIKSRFSVNTGYNQGTRGGTPANYVLQYVARDDAVENIGPTRLQDEDTSALRYQKMDEFSNNASSSIEIKNKAKRDKKIGGTCFSQDDPALSNAGINRIAEEMQNSFNDGHTFIQTVVSFDTEYLQNEKIIDPDLVYKRPGDFAGNIDQLKLRLAIMNGLNRIKGNFDDLHYLGTIQVDTDHVHCHLTIMDFGEGRKAVDGTQRGKLTQHEFNQMRAGIDIFLNEKKSVRMLASSIEHDRVNTVSYIEKVTQKALREKSFPQFLLACLPKNRQLWRAGSNSKEMRKANELTRDFVVRTLQPYDGKRVSSYTKAVKDIEEYANERTTREGEDDNFRMKLIRNGQEKIIERCMNAVYSVLKKVPEEEMNLKTPLLQAMSQDYENMAAELNATNVDDPILEFGFRFRSYSSRLRKHRDAYHKFKSEYEAYEETENKGERSEDLAEFLQFEMLYQQQLMSKYQHFLSLFPSEEDILDEYELMLRRMKRYEKQQMMEKDEMFDVLDGEYADRYGVENYGINHARYIKENPNLWQRMLNDAKSKLDEAVGKLKDNLQDAGFDLDDKNDIIKHDLYNFEEVKALDMHHLVYDFPYDIRVSKKSVDDFITTADKRNELFNKAKQYLIDTKQEDLIEELDPGDIESMMKMADAFRTEDILQSKRPDTMLEHDSSTIRISRKDYVGQMEDSVVDSIDTKIIISDIEGMSESSE